MPKDQVIRPDYARRSRSLEIRPIPVNRPGPSPIEAARSLGQDRVLRVLRDMYLIRHFESALDAVKRYGRFEDIEYRYNGPAHLAIGQEAAAVGQALALSARDHIFGSHRSHGEFIAKGSAAIVELRGAPLAEIMTEHRDRHVLDLLEANLGPADQETRGIQFLLYGLMAEIFGRDTGFNRGMGGSMHTFFRPFGIYPNNAIVGASAPIATGAALYKRVQADPGVVVANIGDAAAGCGPVWESLNFAAMGQLRSLWPEAHAGGLPVVFFFMNNFYGMGGQTIGETMAFDLLSRIGAGVGQDNLNAETIDGNDPLSVFAAMTRAVDAIELGAGPVLLDCQVYRQSGHSASDASSYRTSEELELWKAVDPIVEYRERIEAESLIDAAGCDEMSTWALARVREALLLASNIELSPYLELETLGKVKWSDSEIDLSDTAGGEVIAPLAESPRSAQLARRSRSGLMDGEPRPAADAIQYRDALFEAVTHHVINDRRLIIYGEENRDWGGAFGVYRGLTEILPYHRLFNAPISEAAIVSTAVGYAMEGGRALIELMYADFMGRAGDEIFNQLAKWRAMSGGTLELPVVLRISVGSTYGAQHSQEWTALPAHIPGLKVVFPATPYDAKGLMASALSCNDPVLFFESQSLYGQTELFREAGVPEDYYHVPIGTPKVVRPGDDFTVLTVGAPLYRAIEAADTLASEGISVEVVDARSLVPFDYTLVVESVAKTGRLLCVSDAVEQGNFLNTIACEVQRLAFDSLESPVSILGTPNTIVPPVDLAPEYFPNAKRIASTIATSLAS